MNKNILIIGHKGYLGTSLTKYLMKASNYKLNITGLDYNLFSLNDYSKKNNLIKNIYNDCRKINLKSINPRLITHLALISQKNQKNLV